MKNIFQTILTAIGGFLGWFFGGFVGFLYALLAFVCIDYITGVMVAVVNKTVSSEVGFKGIFKKVLIFTLVGVANIIDVNVLQSGSAIRTAVIFFYLSNEGFSILENAAALDLPIPNKLKEILAQIRKKDEADSTDEGDDGDGDA
mgnify:CR=1 FL=1